MQKGNLYLIPSGLGNNDLKQSITAPVFYIINSIDNYIVENIKSAVGFLKLAGLEAKPQQLNFHVLNIDTKDNELSSMLKPSYHGKHLGLISEAGVPCVADPGAKLVMLAHQHGIKVIPLVGPSSIILALMASGLNGQNFAFNGYLPIEKKARAKKITELQDSAFKHDQTQIFIEAPHRNDKLFEEILASCKNELKLCVAVDITMQTEHIDTMSVREWKRHKTVIGKKPAIFLIGK